LPAERCCLAAHGSDTLLSRSSDGAGSDDGQEACESTGLEEHLARRNDVRRLDAASSLLLMPHPYVFSDLLHDLHPVLSSGWRPDFRSADYEAHLVL